MTTAEICARGKALYDARLKGLLEPKHHGEYLILDIETGEYTIAADYAAPLLEQQRKHAGRIQFVTRIGERALMRRSGRRT